MLIGLGKKDDRMDDAYWVALSGTVLGEALPDLQLASWVGGCHHAGSRGPDIPDLAVP